MAALLWKHNWLRRRQPANSTMVTAEDGGGMEGVSSRTSKRRVAAEPVSLSHLLSVCLLSVLFSLSHRNLMTFPLSSFQISIATSHPPYSLVFSSLSIAVLLFRSSHSSPLPLTFHSPNRKSPLNFPHSLFLLLPLPSTPSLFSPFQLLARGTAD